MQDLYDDIAGFEQWKKMTPINKGWSNDLKFKIETTEGDTYLLRISSKEEYLTKKDDYHLLCQLKELPINIPRPIDFGRCSRDSKVYMLLSYVSGDDAIEVIPSMSDERQYDLGIQAGKILRTIHKTNIDVPQNEWSQRYNQKIDRNILRYQGCPFQFDNSDKVIDFINANRGLLDHRKQVFQHGDYHIGNMVVSEQGELGIIDFDRLDFGEPWEEFNRIAFCAYESPLFASGRIHGYFEGDVPDDFFKLLALYIASNQLASIPWAMDYGQKDIDFMLEQANRVMKWYKNFTTYIPSWYTKLTDIDATSY